MCVRRWLHVMSVTLLSLSAIQLSLSHSFSHSLNTVNPFLSVPPPVEPSVFLHTQELKVETLIIPPVAIGVVDPPSCWHWQAIQIHPPLLVDVFFISGPWNMYSPVPTPQEEEREDRDRRPGPGLLSRTDQ